MKKVLLLLLPFFSPLLRVKPTLSLKNLDYMSSKEGMSCYKDLDDLNSVNGDYPSSPKYPHLNNPPLQLDLNMMSSDNWELESLCSRPSTPDPTMHSHETVPPIPSLGGNDEDPSRPKKVGNSTHESSHSVGGRTLDLLDKVENTEDSIGNGEEMARYKTEDSGNHVIEQDPANTNTQPALQHEWNGLETKHGFDKDNDYDTKSVGGGSSYYPAESRKSDRNPLGFPGEVKRQKRLEKIRECREAGKTIDETALELRVSRSTVKRALTEGEMPWKQIKKGGKQSARSANNTNPAGYDYHPPEFSHAEPVCSAMNSSFSCKKVGEEDNMNDDDELAMKHLNTCAVIAERNRWKVMFDFSYTGTPSLLELEKLVASNFKAFTLEPGRFKLNYKYDHKHWPTMFDDSHLVSALSLAKKSEFLMLKVVDFPSH